MFSIVMMYYVISECAHNCMSTSVKTVDEGFDKYVVEKIYESIPIYFLVKIKKKKIHYGGLNLSTRGSEMIVLCRCRWQILCCWLDCRQAS